MGVVAMLLLGGAGVFGLVRYKQTRPHPVWVPLPINPELSTEKRDEIIKDLKAKLGARETLVNVSKDVGLVEKWHLASDEAGAAELEKRLIVKTGEMDTPMGKVPAIHVGVKGNRKESKVSGEIAMRLMKDVWKILGIPPPAEKK